MVSCHFFHIYVSILLLIKTNFLIFSDCDSVILPRYAEKIKGKEQEFCPRCECKYENRNTTVIKVSSMNLENQLQLLNSGKSLF
jgi:hypothetical protein